MLLLLWCTIRARVVRGGCNFVPSFLMLRLLNCSDIPFYGVLPPFRHSLDQKICSVVIIKEVKHLLQRYMICSNKASDVLSFLSAIVVTTAATITTTVFKLLSASANE
uniref:T. congolense-specific, cell surface-expressed gene family n=1 Tax=Trypanosoma congolense (strain IL3000) TaxID=1068625 RepID=G0UQ32_TRYCI|nr:hypothetical protein, unlikely [Trypanosoma congolense IL3000]